MKSYDIKFGYSSSIQNASTLTPDTSFIEEIKAYANGDCLVVKGLNFFYIFVPYCESWLRNSRQTPQISLPAWLSIDNSNTQVYTEKETISWSEQDEYGSLMYTNEYSYGYYTYKILISKNDINDSRNALINITGYNANPRVEWAQSGYLNDQYPVWDSITVTGSITVSLRGASEDKLEVSSSVFFYRTDNILYNTEISISDYKEIRIYPEVLSDSYSYKNSTQDTLHRFKYIYVRSNIVNYVSNLKFNSDCTWARINLDNYIYTNSTDRYYVNVLQIEVDDNISDSVRSCIIPIRTGDTPILNLTITLYGKDSGDKPVVGPSYTGDAEIDEYEYWKENSSGTVSITDINVGTNFDSTALLFKSNNANIYLTIELKDNTLFLGNYMNSNRVNEIHNILNKYINTNDISVSEGTKKIPIQINETQNYLYIPDLTKSSQYKKLFKHGEQYLLGLVFVNNTGNWSSVYYLGDKGKWSPTVEPGLINDSTKTYYKKPIRYCTLSAAVTSALSSSGIIGVFPVYALKTSHDVLCLGFLSPALSSAKRREEEGLTAQYSWFYRSIIGTSDLYLPTRNNGLNWRKYELQDFDSAYPGLSAATSSKLSWAISRYMCTINSPEIEVDEELTESMLAGCLCTSIRSYKGSDYIYTNNATATVNGKYLHSYFSTNDVYGQKDNTNIVSITNERFISGSLWFGFLDIDPRDSGEDSRGYHVDDRVTATNDQGNYRWFRVYPWLRNKMGGEGPESVITNKRLFNSLYNKCIESWASTPVNADIDIKGVAIYRDTSAPTIIRINSELYLGNVDYIQTSSGKDVYRAWTIGDLFPEAHKDDGVYAGYNTKGEISDPINIKYKVAPHIAIRFSTKLDHSTDSLHCVELFRQPYVNTDTLNLITYLWLKCGDLKRIRAAEPTTVFFEEGDYFFGRFDSLRTYCYTELDSNSIVEIVSGMLCSRVNLDARTDRNRGINTPTVNFTNFNRFNKVYDQLNNYFTFLYVDVTDTVYEREYKNSIQWSLTKLYGSDVDDWCNILDSNTLDLDGDKGELRAIKKLGNNLIAFQDTGISLILYNEKTQIATTEGVPIEIANSGKVNGKFYLYDNIGCLNLRAIAKSPVGLYFIDSINNSIYLLLSNGLILDITNAGGMKSWGLANLNANWWSYYDSNTQEVLFTGELESLSYSDVYLKFNAFLGYGGIKYNFRVSDKTILVCPSGFTQVLQTGTATINSNKRVATKIFNHNNSTNTFWKKNSIDETKFFGKYSPIEIELNCNPEPTLDKTFSVVEYRADAFDKNNDYLPYISFDTFRAWNEYQDTFPTTLLFNPSNSINLSHNRRKTVRLKKKFRTWRIDIPRAKNFTTTNLLGDNINTEDLPNIPERETSLPGNAGYHTGDRIRNPWCKIYLSMDSSLTSKFIVNDLTVQYFK